ncbi:MAG: lipoprotein [Bauldia sp.]|nr:lipoprotein [Bauldia sp.]
MRKLLVAILLVAAVAGCQTAQVTTASGRPEITVPGPPEKIKPLVLNAALNRKFTIKSDTPYTLVIEQPSTDFATNLLLGSQWNPTVNIRLTLTFVPVGGDTRIVAEQVAVTNPGTGAERLTPLTGQKAIDGVQAWLNEFKAPAS